jgi:hypothetical protein
MAFLQDRAPPWAAAALLAAGLLLASPPSARAGTKGGDFNQELASAIDQVTGLVLQADQQGGRDAQELDKALQELVDVLTHEGRHRRHHHHHHHNGLAGGAKAMDDALGQADAPGGGDPAAGNVGAQAGADGGKNGQGGRHGRTRGGRGSDQALASVGGQCGCQGKNAPAQADKASTNADRGGRGGRLGRGIGDMAGAVHCRDRGGKPGDGQAVQARTGSGKESGRTGMHCQVGQQASEKRRDRTASQPPASPPSPPKQPANTQAVGKPKQPANTAAVGKSKQPGNTQAVGKPKPPERANLPTMKTSATHQGTPVQKKVSPGERASSNRTAGKPGSMTQLAGLMAGLMKQKGGTRAPRASSTGAQALLKGAPTKGGLPGGWSGGGAGHTVGHAKGGGSSPSHGAQRTPAPRGGSTGRRK